jgi:hypothetical protein
MKPLVKCATVGPSRIKGVEADCTRGNRRDETPILLTARAPRDIGGHIYMLGDGRHALPCGDRCSSTTRTRSNVWPLPDLLRRVMRRIAVRDIAPGEEVSTQVQVSRWRKLTS